MSTNDVKMLVTLSNGHRLLATEWMPVHDCTGKVLRLGGVLILETGIAKEWVHVNMGQILYSEYIEE